MIKNYFTIVLIAVCLPTFVLAKRKESDVDLLKKRIVGLQDEITSASNSLKALDAEQERLNQELQGFESGFKYRFESVLTPLLNWPALSITLRSPSWVLQEHMKMVMLKARERMIREPLELISDRELRIAQATTLKSDFSQTLKSLESKQALLDLQLEELRMLERKQNRKPAINHSVLK